MKKKISMLIVFVLLAAMLGGCQLFCKHEWADATCETPKTCAKCEKTEGEALGHSWAEATCEAPKTCATCAVTEGEALGHSWVEATCEEPKTCTTCAATEGEALGHTWEEATTETPKTCTVCAVTEGEPLDTDDRFTTAATKELQGKWVSQMEMSGTDMGLEGFQGTLPVAMYVEFSNVGDMVISMGVEDEDGFYGALAQYMEDLLYAEFANQGVDKAAADQAMLATYGVTMDEYAQMTASALSISDLLGSVDVSMVYYVEGDQLYTSLTWGGTFENETFQIADGVLTMEKTTMAESGEPLEWTRVEE